MHRFNDEIPYGRYPEQHVTCTMFLVAGVCAHILSQFIGVGRFRILNIGGAGGGGEAKAYNIGRGGGGGARGANF